MKKFCTAAMAAMLSVSMVFSSLAATKLATPQIRWSTTKEAEPEWSRVDGAAGEYKLETYQDGERFTSVTHSYGATYNKDWMSGHGFINDLTESGIYKFRVMALGDGNNTEDSDWSSFSSEWNFKMPSVKFGTPTNLRWDGTITRWDAPEIPSQYKDCLSGYEVTLYGDGKRLIIHNAVGRVETYYDNKEWMNREGVENYTFSVRAITNKPSVIFNGDMAYSDDSYDTPGAAGNVSETISGILESGSVDNAPDTLNTKFSDLQVAMQSDEGVRAQVEELEKQYSTSKGLTLDVKPSDDCGISSNDVKVLGALLNAKEGTTQMSFNIKKPAKEVVVDNTAYKNSIQFDLGLTGAASTLKVPVRVTMPIPDGINPDFLHILHYHADGSYEDIIPLDKSVDGVVSFTVDSFSPFVFAEEGMDIKNIATPSNADEFMKIVSVLPEADKNNPLYNPLEDVPDEEREEYMNLVFKLVAALEGNSKIGSELLKDEDTVYQLSAILAWCEENDLPRPEMDSSIEQVMYHSLAFASEFGNELEGIRAELKTIATPSNASSKYSFRINLYKTVDGTEQAVEKLYAPMKFCIPLPEGYKSASGSADSSIITFDEDNNWIVIYTLKPWQTFNITLRKAASNSSPRPSGGGSSSGKVIVPYKPEGGKWVKSGSNYNYYYANGIMALGCWLELDWNNTRHWYYFDISGNMVTGWFKDNLGNWYYLNPTSSGVYGSMVTGWNLIDGKWYYFNEKSDGFKGTLFVDCTTPDGYQVDNNGVWIQ